ncbi:uncharacterized protein LOC141920522 [Strix aluco]|uniref:uncharacterized protein LOC141920522 n=1 Tax=Strix aluco TaxID=111821 RepID=UPI003DA55A85
MGQQACPSGGDRSGDWPASAPVTAPRGCPAPPPSPCSLVPEGAGRGRRWARGGGVAQRPAGHAPAGGRPGRPGSARPGPARPSAPALAAFSSPTACPRSPHRLCLLPGAAAGGGAPRRSEERPGWCVPSAVLQPLSRRRLPHGLRHRTKTFNVTSGLQDLLAEFVSAAVAAKPRWMWNPAQRWSSATGLLCLLWHECELVMDFELTGKQECLQHETGCNAEVSPPSRWLEILPAQSMNQHLIDIFAWAPRVV